jgi:phospholipid/cholesterol/gamma-HCH transport system ATP-binding protein
MTEEPIVIKNLTKHFNGIKVLDNLSFTLRKKENLVILGKSGSGKSVLLKIIVGLIEADRGTVNVLGNDITLISEEDLISLRKKIGYLFQEGALYDAMTIRENVAFPLRRQINRKSTIDIEESVVHSLDQLGLLDSIDKIPQELSGGMKKRVALARALILEPQIILYDEPTTGLDPVTSREINRLILEMRDKFQVSSIIVTHDLNCARMTGDRILVLNEGTIGAEGTYKELESSEEQLVKNFFH